jgi:hypothetical protein
VEKTNAFEHHKTSGQIDDNEERLIGLELPLGLKQLCICLLLEHFL